MLKSVTALGAALVAGGLLAASTIAANAHCPSCGPLAPVTYYKTVHPTRSVVQYRDVTAFQHVNRVRQIYSVTVQQPIINVHEITRVHHQTVVHTSNAYHQMTENMAPVVHVYRSTEHFYDCGCGS